MKTEPSTIYTVIYGSQHFNDSIIIYQQEITPHYHFLVVNDGSEVINYE